MAPKQTKLQSDAGHQDKLARMVTALWTIAAYDDVTIEEARRIASAALADE